MLLTTEINLRKVKKEKKIKPGAKRRFYRVVPDFTNMPTQEYHFYGYETENDFYQALLRLINRWQNRVGEAVEEKSRFLLLRFHDTPGGHPDEAWLPQFVLEPAIVPDCFQEEESPDASEKELNHAFGFE